MSAAVLAAEWRGFRGERTYVFYSTLALGRAFRLRETHPRDSNNCNLQHFMHPQFQGAVWPPQAAPRTAKWHGGVNGEIQSAKVL